MDEELKFIARFEYAHCNLYQYRNMRGVLRSEIAAAPFYPNLELWMRGKACMPYGVDDVFLYQRDVFIFVDLWAGMG